MSRHGSPQRVRQNTPLITVKMAVAEPIPTDSQYDEDVVMASLTPEEQAAIAVEDWG